MGTPKGHVMSEQLSLAIASAAPDAPLRVLVCGSRSWMNVRTIHEALAKLPPGSTVIHGGAKGADEIAASCAVELGFHVETYLADWERYGRAAGPIRNRVMLRVGRPDRVFAFFLGTLGTADLLRQARAAGVPVTTWSAS